VPRVRSAALISSTAEADMTSPDHRSYYPKARDRAERNNGGGD
jgi:hypothetical protein